MRIRADEHVSLGIVHMVRDLALSAPFELTSVYETAQRGTDDAYWVTQFADDGGDAILTADTDFFKKPHQVVAIYRTGLRVIYLPPKWANAQRHLQAAHILMWWRRIAQKLLDANPREVWVVKWNVSEDGDLERKKVNYAEAHKKLRKANRRSI